MDIIHRDVKVDNIGIDLEGGIESLKLFTHFAHKEQLDPSSLSVQPHSRDETSSSQDPELKLKQSQVLGSVQARLIDFGMSLRLDQHSNIIIEGSTANYKSPEVCKRYAQTHSGSLTTVDRATCGQQLSAFTTLWPEVTHSKVSTRKIWKGRSSKGCPLLLDSCLPNSKISSQRCSA